MNLFGIPKLQIETVTVRPRLDQLGALQKFLILQGIDFDDPFTNIKSPAANVVAPPDRGPAPGVYNTNQLQMPKDPLLQIDEPQLPLNPETPPAPAAVGPAVKYGKKGRGPTLERAKLYEVILEAIDTSPNVATGVSTKEIAHETRLHPSSALGLLHDLELVGRVERVPSTGAMFHFRRKQ